MLFPGGSQLVQVRNNEAGVQSLQEAFLLHPPVFAFATIDAWGSPSDVGTLAVIDEMRVGATEGDATVLCSGLGRWRRGQSGRVEELWDDAAREGDEEKLKELDDRLVTSLMELVRLSIQVAGLDVGKEMALEETMKRMQALVGSSGLDNDESGDEDAGDFESEGGGDGTSAKVLQHWVDMRNDKSRRRELLSFITMDMMNLSFMDRMALLRGTDTMDRLRAAEEVLEPFVKELAAKAAIQTALG